MRLWLEPGEVPEAVLLRLQRQLELVEVPGRRGVVLVGLAGLGAAVGDLAPAGHHHLLRGRQLPGAQAGVPGQADRRQDGPVDAGRVLDEGVHRLVQPDECDVVAVLKVAVVPVLVHSDAPRGGEPPLREWQAADAVTVLAPGAHVMLAKQQFPKKKVQMNTFSTNQSAIPPT